MKVGAILVLLCVFAAIPLVFAFMPVIHTFTNITLSGNMSSTPLQPIYNLFPWLALGVVIIGIVLFLRK